MAYLCFDPINASAAARTAPAPLPAADLLSPAEPAPPAPAARQRHRSSVASLLLVAAILGVAAGIALYFGMHPNGQGQLAVARAQAESITNDTVTYLSRTLSDEQPIVVIESPLLTPTPTPLATLTPTLTPSPTATLTPTLTATAPSNTATPSPTATATTAPPTPTDIPSSTPQSIGEVVREIASPTPAPVRRATSVPQPIRATQPARPSQPPLAATAIPTVLLPQSTTEPPTATPEGKLPEGSFPPLPTPPP